LPSHRKRSTRIIPFKGTINGNCKVTAERRAGLKKERYHSVRQVTHQKHVVTIVVRDAVLVVWLRCNAGGL
jgi:hypothetical protein